MRKKPVWHSKAKIKFETTNLTLEEIAIEFDKAKSTVYNLSAQENWAKNQKENSNEIVNEIVKIKNNIIKETAEKLKPEIESKFREIIEDDELLKRSLKLQRARRAFGTIKNLYDDNDKLKKVKDLTEDEAPLIAGMKVTDRFSGGEDGEAWQEKEYKLINNEKDLEALEKMVGLYEKDNRQKQNTEMSDLQFKELMASVKGRPFEDIQHLINKTD